MNIRITDEDIKRIIEDKQKEYAEFKYLEENEEELIKFILIVIKEMINFNNKNIEEEIDKILRS